MSQDAFSVFVEAPIQEYLIRLLSEVNPENIENLIKGLQTVPTVTGGNVTETLFQSTNGTFHTPWFGEKIEGKLFLSQTISIAHGLSSRII